MRSLVLLSGGLDSITVATLALQRRTLDAVLMADYGQPHAAQELAAARAWVAGHPVRAVEAIVPMPGVESMHLGAGETGPRVLHGRNLVLISHAVGWAGHLGCDEVLIGCNAADAADYPDCRRHFVDWADRCAAFYGIRVRAPLIDLDKRGVVALARRLGVDIGATWSCYEPRDGRPCGGCNACNARNSALEAS